MQISAPAMLPSLTIGGRVFTDLTNLITLETRCHTGFLNCTARKLGASAGYQVTAGKTLTIYATQYYGGGANFALQYVQSDNDVGYDSGTAFTNPVYPAGSATSLFISSPAANTIASFNWPFPVAATKFFGVIGTTGGDNQAIHYGYEA